MKREKTKLITSIGGQALMEGVMMRGPHRTVAAVRNADGDIVLKDIEPLNLGKKCKFFRLPIVRGIVNMIDSFATGYKALMYSTEVAIDGVDEPEEEMSKLDKWIDKHFGEKFLNVFMVIMTVVIFVACIAAFFFVPSWLYNLLVYLLPGIRDIMLLRSVFEGVVKIILLVAYMALCLVNKEVKRLYRYHGAEHKTIFCYEYGLELTVENVMKQKRFHPRCGTSFIIIILMLGIFVGCLIPFTDAFLRTGVRLLCMPIVIGLGYELIKLCGRHDNLLTSIIAAPGMWMQRLTTKEPDAEMIEAAIAAMKAVIPENGEDKIG